MKDTANRTVQQKSTQRSRPWTVVAMSSTRIAFHQAVSRPASGKSHPPPAAMIVTQFHYQTHAHINTHTLPSSDPTIDAVDILSSFLFINRVLSCSCIIINIRKNRTKIVTTVHMVLCGLPEKSNIIMTCYQLKATDLVCIIQRRCLESNAKPV